MKSLILRFFSSVSSRLALSADRVRDGFIDDWKRSARWLVVLMLVFSLGNVLAKYGGNLEGTITDRKNPSLISHQYVQEHTKFSNAFKLGIKCPDGITLDALKKMDYWTRKLKDELGERVMSLSTGLPNTRVVEGRVQKRPYVTRDMLDELTEEEWNAQLDAWKEFIRNDPAYKFLIEADFSALSIIINLDRGDKDIHVYKAIKEIVEKREFRWWELLKWIHWPAEGSEIPWWRPWDRLPSPDIRPSDPDLMVAGWPVARGLLFVLLYFDMITKIGFGIILLFFLFRVILGSWPQAIFSTLNIVVSIWWMRGSIGIINLAGFGLEDAMHLLGLGFTYVPLRERVYILAAMTVCIVQGASFPLHKFSAYNRVGSWRAAKSVDWAIFNTALISFFGFATLWVFDLWSIKEMGLICALAVVYMFILSTLFIPSLASMPFLVRYMKPKRVEGRRSGPYAKFIGMLSDGCTYAALRLKGWVCLVGTGVVIAVALVLVFVGNLEIGTRPLEYMRGKEPVRAAEFYNEEGRSGFASLSIYVESAQEDGLADTGYISDISNLRKEILKGDARGAVSIVDFFEKLSYQREGMRIPPSNKVARNLINQFDDMSPENKLNQWTERGVRMLAFTRMDSSRDMKRFNDSVVALDKDFANLRIFIFDDGALYPEEDRYIVEGKPNNIGGGEILVILFCMGLIYWKGRLLRSRRRLEPVLGGFFMGLPFLFASSVTFIVMMAKGIPLDVATALITAMAINASVDFSIHYTDKYQEELVHFDKNAAVRAAMRTRGEIIINDVFLNSLCFAPLISSSIIPMSRLGVMMILMIVACGFGSLIIMASAMRYAVDFSWRKVVGLDKRRVRYACVHVSDRNGSMALSACSGTCTGYTGRRSHWDGQQTAHDRARHSKGGHGTSEG